MPEMTRGLVFLCVPNSSRSQMAEGLARAMAAPPVEVMRTGSEPTGVNPFAVQTLVELDLDFTGHASTAVAHVAPEAVHAGITLCAEEVCSVFLGEAERHHIRFEDPAAVEGSDAEKLTNFSREASWNQPGA